MPVEPVGLGAVWQSTRQSAATGFTIEQTSTITLEDVSPDGTFSLSGLMRTVAEPQPLTLPGLPDEIEATLDEFVGNGSFQVLGHLTRVVRLGGLTSSTSYGFTIDAGEESQSTLIELTLELELLPGEG